MSNSTIKYLTGPYPGGYNLKTNYTGGLYIDTGASVGGPGVCVGFNTSIVNHGTVNATTGGSNGLYLVADGTVTNGSATTDQVALIEGSDGVAAVGLSGLTTVANYGTIQGTGGLVGYFGVFLGGGTVTNGSANADRTALISGAGGVYASGLATIANFGTIRSTYGGGAYGVYLGHGGSVTNGSNGSAGDKLALIEGSVGLKTVRAAPTVANFGTIEGTGGGGSRGIFLGAAGTVTNGSASGDTTALIEGQDSGIYTVGPSTITNFGTIQGGVFGVYLAGGTVTNGSAGDRTALIEGGVFGVNASHAATVKNFGTILGTGGAAVQLEGAGETVTNGSAADTRALISGVGGVFAAVGPVVITNFGTIEGGAGGVGVRLDHGGTVTNGSATDRTALIEGYYGGVVQTVGAITVTNFGTIGETGYAAVEFGSAGGVLVDEAGSVFKGVVVGGGGTLELASGVGMIALLGTNFSGFGNFVIEAGGTWTVTGTNAVGAGATLTVRGTLINDGTGVSVIAAKTIDSGSVEAATGTLDFAGALVGAGAMSVDSGATLEVDSTAGSSLSMAFNSASGTLALKDPSKFKATINGFALGDTIDLLGRSADSAVWAGGFLTIKNGTQPVATLKLAGAYTGGTFHTGPDGNGGTDITFTTPAGASPPVGAAAMAASHGFIAAMASLGAGDGVAHATAGTHPDAWRPLLAAPRMQFA